MKRVLLFGGSFDPIHHGHLIVGRHAAEQVGAAQLVLIPSGQPPHKLDRCLSPGPQRLAMCRAAVAGQPLFDVSDTELRRPGPHYTLETVRSFRAALGPAVELMWLIGLDSLGELGTWYRATELVDECTIVTVARPGVPRPGADQLATHFAAPQVARLLAHLVAGPRIEISSTEIRVRVAGGRSVRYLVPEAVEAYIKAEGLYRRPD